MKKVITIILVVLFITGFGFFALADSVNDDKQVNENPNLILATVRNDKQQEKILNVASMKFFDKIVKIGKSLYGVRRSNVLMPELIKPENVQCVKDAVSKKSMDLKESMNSHGQQVISIVEVRTACELTALDLTAVDQQAAANDACIANDKKSMAEVERSFAESKLSIQKAFQNTVRACRK